MILLHDSRDDTSVEWIISTVVIWWTGISTVSDINYSRMICLHIVLLSLIYENLF